jgi:cytochrome P450
MILAMVHYPHVLEKAQLQLDEVVGYDRLPDFTDRDRLPYIDCILKEVLRWGTPVPLSMLASHCSEYCSLKAD